MSRRLAEGEVVRLVSRGAAKRMEVHTRDSISVGELTRSMPRLSGVVFGKISGLPHRLEVRCKGSRGRAEVTRASKASGRSPGLSILVN
jgi:hypothetical protein